MSVSVNSVIRATVVIFLATLLLIPLIRPAKKSAIHRPNVQKLQDFVNRVANFATASSEAVKEIDSIAGFNSLLLNDSQLLQPLHVLQKLIPGNVLKDPISDEYQLVWKCNACKPVPLHDPIAECFDIDTSIGFPFASNFTSFIGQYEISGLDSNKQRLFAYSTSSLQVAQGRFSGGILSLLLLEKSTENPNAWRVKAFNPAVVYQGGFGLAAGISSVLCHPVVGNLLVLNVNSLLDADVENCYSPVEDTYLIDGNRLELLVRIPGAQKKCTSELPSSPSPNFPEWNTQINLLSGDYGTVTVELDVQGMYMTSTELDAKQQHMGLLKDFNKVLRKQFPEKFIDFQDGSVKDASVNMDVNTRAKADSLTTNPTTNDRATSLVPFFIPYKAKISATLSKSANSNGLLLAPWKVQYTWQ